MESDFSVLVTTLDGATVIRVTGEIDMGTAPNLLAAIEPHAGCERTVLVDLAGVTFMDSSGLAAVIAMRRLLSEQNTRTVFREPSEAVRLVFDTVGLTVWLDDEWL